ncbi:SRPBCC domain-containing protein [Variovorax sp. J22R133]|uniref:SRPBCC family protein n=1 Tax=Variovorax brevis TaxID=3053503 RepID=UPI002575293F|nr:SRPBCC domain-containing protein [Variovorax sp. J22R133]MDM0112870.1 SRPBCC domain-containing protein [Variovorax sp. J22R133]
MAQTAGTAARADKPALRLQRHFEVAPEKVWHAWTDPKALSVWFGPGHDNSVLRASVDLRVGGHFNVAFNTKDGGEHEVNGVYREVVPQRKLVFTWAWVSTPERESLVTVRFEPTATGTQMDFLHEQFHDEVARDDHEGGWTPTFEKLARFVHTF